MYIYRFQNHGSIEIDGQADRMGLTVGDVIDAIDSLPVEYLNHAKMIELLSSDHLTITVGVCFYECF